MLCIKVFPPEKEFPMYNDPVSRYFAVSSARSVMASSALGWFTGYGGNFDQKKYNRETKKEMDGIHAFIASLPPTVATQHR